MTKPHKDFDLVNKRLAGCLGFAKAVEATLVRNSEPVYATSADLTSGMGSRMEGGRWNPVGIPTVYASRDIDTAVEELRNTARYFGVPLCKMLPRTFVALKTKLSSVLDLTDARVRNKLRIARKALLDTDWIKEQYAGNEAITQALGRAGIELGLEGLIVPAIMKASWNLVVFPDNLRRNSYINSVGLM